MANGDISTFAKAKDKILLGLVALAVAAMWFLAARSQVNSDAVQAEIQALHTEITGVRAEVADTRAGVAELHGIVATNLTSQQNGGGVSSGREDEAVRRLDAIDQKLDRWGRILVNWDKDYQRYQKKYPLKP